LTQLLLDTNILIALAQGGAEKLDLAVRSALASTENIAFASAASLWEIAIKTRLGKLNSGRPLEVLPDYFQAMGVNLLAVDHRHATAQADPEPPTRDPFDRLLLAQCAVENLRLVTTDRVLAAHPAAWLPA
jgi:PIN domain nuclease of toxin-antitoxin system